MSNEASGWVWKHSPYRGAELLVHLAIADVVNDIHDNEFWMSTARLADKAKVARSTVTATLTKMVAAGLLEIIEAGASSRKPSRYRFRTRPESGHAAETASAPSGPGMTGERSSTRPESGHKPKKEQPKRTQSSVAAAPASSLAKKPTNDQVEAIFNAWVTSTARTNRTVLTAKRRRYIVAALGLYPFEDVLDAINGWKLSPYHRGDNADKKVWNDIELLLRDAQHIEQFRDFVRSAGPGNQRTLIERVADAQAELDRPHKLVDRYFDWCRAQTGEGACLADLWVPEAHREQLEAAVAEAFGRGLDEAEVREGLKSLYGNDLTGAVIRAALVDRAESA